MTNQERRQAFSQEASHEHRGLTILNSHPTVMRLLYAIRSDAEGGVHLRNNLEILGTSLGLQYMQFQSLSIQKVPGPFGDVPFPSFHPPLVLAIPRGGTALGEGIAKATGSTLLLTNDGQGKEPNKPLLPQSFPYGEHIPEVILADTVTATGQTVLKTMKELTEKAQIGKITYITALSTPYALREIASSYPQVDIITGDIEEQSSWMRKDGKPSLFINGIGDVGDLVSKENAST